VSGTDGNNRTEQALDRLEELLDRRTPLAPIAALRQAVNVHSRVVPDLERIAFGFDSSVFIRLATHRRSPDILDYLPRHQAPLVLPGQAMQEFWNNRLTVVNTISDSVRKKYNELALEMRKIGAQFENFDERMKEVLDNFQSEFGYVYDENTRESVAKMLVILEERAYCSYVPRTRFSSLAHTRKRTKTPPGFRDEGDGDFFVWADFLFGLIVSAPDRERFDHVVLLTNDIKSDWSTAGTPHPLLSAEIEALFGVNFDLWTLDKFATVVSAAV
jgi:hypothetical protein